MGELDVAGDACPLLEGVLADDAPYAAVPQATTTTRATPVKRLVDALELGMSTWPSRTRPRSVLATASGSSETSFAMNDDHPPLSGAGIPLTSNGSTSTIWPAKSVTVTPSGVIATIWSCPIARARRVCSTKAATSEPRKFSPSPSPITSGELRRAPTTRPGWSRCMASSVNAPSRRPATVAERRHEVPAVRAVLVPEQHRRHLGVGLAAERVAHREELGLQLCEVLDDAVVDDGELVVVGQVRVGVAVGRPAVRRPARVADAGRAVGRGAVSGRRARRELARALAHVQVAVSSMTAMPAES